ncbi:TetR family transcriptional regulator [Arthrobacter sp. AQ5-06]|nr:TetR family transcriptional regulator [Arthrobacter sp. AQ5-06]
MPLGRPEETPVAGTRSAKAARTRESILDAASSLIVSRGIGALSLRDIASKAGISHPGLLRHFSSKGELLLALVERFTTRTTIWINESGHGPGLASAVAVAEHNASEPGYIELFTALAGEATAKSHPAHNRLAERYGQLRRTITDDYGSDPEARSYATRFAAGWDGLQLQALYEPSIDVAAALGRVLNPGMHASDTSPTLLPPDPLPISSMVQSEKSGYANGRKRRATIIADASHLFAERGYYATSLREIAESVGISKSTLLHHFGSKEDLLTAVLVHRDQVLLDVPERRGGPRAELTGVVQGARSLCARPGLIELYIVMSCGAVAPGHPAHDYFVRRNESGRSYFKNLFERLQASGDVAMTRDPAHEAAWLMAVWDGLQLQWLYDPDAVDVAEELAAQVASVLEPVNTLEPAVSEPGQSALNAG